MTEHRKANPKFGRRGRRIPHSCEIYSTLQCRLISSTALLHVWSASAVHAFHSRWYYWYDFQYPWNLMNIWASATRLQDSTERPVSSAPLLLRPLLIYDLYHYASWRNVNSSRTWDLSETTTPTSEQNWYFGSALCDSLLWGTCICGSWVAWYRFGDSCDLKESWTLTTNRWFDYVEKKYLGCG